MSIEQTIQANTAAMVALTAALGKGGGTSGVAGATQTTGGKKSAAAGAGSKAADATAAVTQLVLTLASTKPGRAACIKILAKYDAEKLKDVPKAKHPAMLKDLRAVASKLKKAADAAEAKAAALAAEEPDDDLMGLDGDDDPFAEGEDDLDDDPFAE